MSALSHDIAALIRNHAVGDSEGLLAVAKDAALREQREGRRKAAQEIREAIEIVQEPLGQDVFEDDQLVDSDLAEFIQVSRPEGKLNELIVANDLVERVEQLLKEQRNADELRDLGFAPAHRVLMEGPAGTGKTATANIIAAEMKLPLVTVWLDNLLSVYSSEDSAPMLRELFKRLARRRAVYLFDVFDTAATPKEHGQTIRRIFKSFLMFLEGLGQGSIAIAATNRRSALERSMLRHFDTVLSYSLPDDEEAMKVIRAELGDRAPEAVLNEGDIYAQYMAGLSHAEVTLAAQDAAKSAILRMEYRVTEDDIIHGLTSRAGHILDHENDD